MAGARQKSRRALRGAWALLLGAVLVACGSGERVGAPAAAPEPTPPDSEGNPPAQPEKPGPCHPIYADALLPTFEVEVAGADWQAMEAAHRARRETGIQVEDYYPAVFRYGDQVLRDASIRLRGGNSECGNKMQFAISFNQVSSGGRFQGLRRINLDHGGCDIFSERLALSYLRDLGLPASCANHARLVVNGRYYGLFLNVEAINKDFLKRNFTEAKGNLYKQGGELKTNEESGDTSDLTAFWAVRDLPTLEASADLEAAVRVWAAEAVLPANDGYWLTNWNYYLYHHPTRGFLWLPTDLDEAFPLSDEEALVDIFFPEQMQQHGRIALSSPVWRAAYLREVSRAMTAFDPVEFEARLERWEAQVREANIADPHTPYSQDAFEWRKAVLYRRAAWLKTWRPPAR